MPRSAPSSTEGQAPPTARAARGARRGRGILESALRKLSCQLTHEMQRSDWLRERLVWGPNIRMRGTPHWPLEQCVLTGATVGALGAPVGERLGKDVDGR